MNGLEAIKFMEKGNIAKADCIGGTFLFKIENGIVKYKPNIGDWDYKETEHFCLSNEYEEYIESKQLTGWERLKDGGEYYYISPSGDFLNSTEDSCDYDDLIYGRANYFSTKEKAEEINFKQTLFRKLQRFSDENGGNEIDWSCPYSKKFFIAYKDGRLFYDWMTETKYFGQVYFASREVVRNAIELFHDDLIKYFTHDWRKGE